VVIVLAISFVLGYLIAGLRALIMKLATGETWATFTFIGTLAQFFQHARLLALQQQALSREISRRL
jgi:hypothetical protein